jgi:hypothetical protein
MASSDIPSTALFMTGADYQKKRRHHKKHAEAYKADHSAGSKKMSLGYLLKYY